MSYADDAPERADEAPKVPSASAAASFDDLYDELAAQVYGVAAQVLRDPVLAEDISEQVLVQLYREAERGECDDLRRQATVLSHRAAVCSLRFGAVADPAPATPDQELPAELVALVDRLPEAQRLSEHQRRCLALAFYRGHSYEEIARLNDTDLVEVSNDLRAGLHQLQG